MWSCSRFASVAVVLLGFGIAFARRFINKPIDSWKVPELKGKVFVITGTTAGIGGETARMLAEWKATVLCANRNVAKSQRGQDSWQVLSKDVEHHELDLASFASVRLFAKNLAAQERKIDGLILNAATLSDDNSSDGVNMQYQVNHLSHFLMVNLLLPVLAEDARVVFVSSNLHYNGVIDQLAFNAQAKGADPKTRRSGFALYSDTKLMNTMTAVELDLRLKEAGRMKIAVTSVHPGFVKSSLDDDASGFAGVLVPAIRQLLARDTTAGALTQLRVATDKALANAGGRYFSDDCINDLCAGLEPHADAKNATLRRWLWDTSAKIVGGI